jgi:hypothetical protein
MKKLLIYLSLPLLLFPLTIQAETFPEDAKVFPVHGYVTVNDGCMYSLSGPCLRIRLGPGTTYSIDKRTRINSLFEVDAAVWYRNELWWRIVLGTEHLHHPERVHGTWYVSGRYTTWTNIPPAPPHDPNKTIVVDLSEQKIDAYQGDTLVYSFLVSTGRDDLDPPAPTKTGTYRVIERKPSVYMQGPQKKIGILDTYDEEGVPYNLLISYDGTYIHGAQWHNSFGKQHSHGCINLHPKDAKTLYNWTPVGTKVVVRD